MKHQFYKSITAIVLSSLLLVGCQPATNQTVNQTANQTNAAFAGSVMQIQNATYDERKQMATVYVAPNHGGLISNELIDTADKDGIVNYATAKFPIKVIHSVTVVRSTPPQTSALATTASGQNVTPVKGWVSYHSEPKLQSGIVGRLQLGQTAPLVQKYNQYWYEINVNGRNVYITTNSAYVRVENASHTSTTTVSVPSTVSNPSSPSSPSSTSATSSISLPPSGARIDYSITPIAGQNASRDAKTSAVLFVAQSKIGTPYIWGHNEDRGQYGFDCSNFTEYVYHHALSYVITTFSTKQYSSVGVPVPVSQMQPGDLIAFNQGSHVGIYAGNNKCIQCGGGLKKVGYISVAKGTYWGDHISAIKRMY